MSKRRYRSIEFAGVDWASVRAQVTGGRVAFNVDVAKHDFVATVMRSEQEVVVTTRWRHPEQTRPVVERLRELAQEAQLEVVMEPSGTYGDALCGQVRAAGIKVFRISPKRVHDAAEIYDGVPSLHDAKAAYLIGRLHFQGVSEVWAELSVQRRELKALLSQLERYKARQQRGRNRLEAQLSRHWPESLELLGLDAVSLLEVLTEYGDAAQVAADRAGSEALLRRCGRARLSAEKIAALLRSATQTVGLACVDAERALVQGLARDVLCSRRQVREVERLLQAQVAREAALERIGAVIGTVSAAVLWASQGDPRDYPDGGSFLKGCGLNLKERSSGQHQGQLKITKRGPSVVRFYLYYAALRLLAHDPLVQRWYAAKIARPGAVKGKCVVALMRKLVQALWHVARGAEFDARKLFNLKAIGA